MCDISKRHAHVHAQNGNVRVWDLTANACSCELVPEGGTAIRSVSAASDGSMVIAANNNGTCYVWRLSSSVSPASTPSVSKQQKNQREEEMQQQQQGDEGSAAPGMSGNSLPGQQQQQQQHMTTMFEPLHKLQAHDGYILKCLISPDVNFICTTSSDHTAKLWSLDGFQLMRTLRGHQRWVWDVVSSVDAAYLVTASSDTQARLWDVNTGEAIRIYSGHQKACSCCALNDNALGEATV